MRNQVNINPGSHYVINAGGLVKLSDMITTKTAAGKSEDAMAAESVETNIQHVVGDGGQRVITIVTDQHGNLQPAALGQQFIFTLQGQQMVALSAGAFTEEVVVEDQPAPKRKTANHVGLKQKRVKESREQLEQQLQEAKLKAHEYQQQLLQKEQEAEQYRLQLEQAIATSNNTTTTTTTAATEKQEEQLETAEEAATQEVEAEERNEEGEVVSELAEGAAVDVELHAAKQTEKASPCRRGRRRH
ncbi:GA-binding protein subunit beta-2 [Larimichthys crocea]|uniref:GA-binding protein subunit beta-2 n=1 Tax=Larimichthys crocea TaxID=215358 RepID=A0A6G0IZL4_LARCR|nr:GA-binding protein subunit beta-2 [Larimichthys crocea]